ncbi:shikimate kinase [uncultured Ezakiella sp.]|uniref:shikimate kinase n=1 Tax=uncultured Ezakiella sp. TaxID=1637529 RepID=UPI0025F4C1AE|nr:shikimate kinase [uncultured Ezakiella sp.]
MNIVLIGLPGSGKTTVGKILSEKIKREFFDSDFEIESAQGKSINEIFKNGEEYFRDIETEVLKKILVKDNIILASGGGIVERACNIDLLKDHYVIFLDRSVEDILKNLDESNRPLLKENPYENLKNISDKRREKYLSVADFVVSESTANDIVDEIIKKINEELI